MTSFNKLILSALLIPLLSSCGLCVTYQLNPTAPHAKVITKNYKFFSNQNELMVAGNYLTCSPPHNTVSHGNYFTIDAGQPTTFIIIRPPALTYVITFTPKQNHVYSFETEKVRSGQDLKVTLSVFDESEANRKVPFVIRDYESSAIYGGSCNDTNKNVLHSPMVTSWGLIEVSLSPMVLVIH
jgi:hypothetical protein